MTFISPQTILVLSALIASGACIAKDEVNILFLGNSFTFRHELPNLVETVLEEGDPETNVNVTRVTYGGQNMFKHSTYYFSQSFIEQSTITNEEITARIGKMKALLESERPPNPGEWIAHSKSLHKGAVPKFADIHSHIKKAIKGHEQLLTDNSKTKWDYVVMQSWRDVSAEPNQGYAKYATLLSETVREQGAEVILYMTSPATQNAKPVSEPFAPEDADRDLAVGMSLAKSIKPKAIIHVPLAIKMIQTGGTDLLFRYVNDGHPNQTCAFLTSNLFYAAMSGKSPEGFAYDTVETKEKNGKTPDGGELKMTFDGATKLQLQKVAFEAAQEFNRLASAE
jgi:hypothetical protein